MNESKDDNHNSCSSSSNNNNNNNDSSNKFDIDASIRYSDDDFDSDSSTALMCTCPEGSQSVYASDSSGKWGPAPDGFRQYEFERGYGIGFSTDAL